uniref:Uncharacterized protein n=1 Tax=Auxenochlorella protothecoides TaxID=3075 RepID=A0A1D1ZV90_AUXPR
MPAPKALLSPRRGLVGWRSRTAFRRMLLVFIGMATVGLVIWGRPATVELDAAQAGDSSLPGSMHVQGKLSVQDEDSQRAGVDTESEPDPPQKVPFALNTTAVLVPPETLPSSPDACAEALGIPKVALLFLTRGDLYLSPAWRLWFQSAAGVVPRTAARCSGVASEAVRAGCPGPGPTAALDLPDERMIDAQHLFTAYVHAPPSVNASEIQPLFRDRLIAARTETSWGSINLVYAARLLLWEAFRDPANTRFVLLSESDIPLYDARTFHHQLMQETLSKTSACPATAQDKYRWNKAMRSDQLGIRHWRKASQWFMLTREHAKVVLEDVHVFKQFEAYCYSGWDPDINKWRNCYSDEHYLATLFAVHGLQQTENCDVWGVAAVDWGHGGAHPRSYARDDWAGHRYLPPGCLSPASDWLRHPLITTTIRAEETTADLVHAIRTRHPCQPVAAMEAAQPYYEVLDANRPLEPLRYFQNGFLVSGIQWGADDCKCCS